MKKSSISSIQAEDGSWLEVKQGEIQDRDGNTVSGSPERADSRPGPARSVPGGMILGFALTVLAPFLLFAGFAVFMVILLLVMIIWGASALFGRRSGSFFIRRGK